MIKAYFNVVEVGKTKDGKPYRMLQLITVDQKTGQLFKIFEFSMKPSKLDLFDTMLEIGILKHDNDDI